VTPEVEARMIAALGLARRGYAIAQVYGVGVDGVCHCPRGATCDPKNAGKHGGTGWLEQATIDPDVIRTRFLAGDPGYGVVPLAGSRLVIVDEDRPGALETLGPLPHTLVVRTGLKADGARGRHVYGRLPDGIDESEVPYRWTGGEVRAAGNGQVIGPYSRHRSGVIYEPLNGAMVDVLPEAWVRALIAGARRQDAERTAARTRADPGWKITTGRHPWLVGKARTLRGDGLTGERLFDELTRLDLERCDPPLTNTPGRGPDELREIVAWVMGKIDDDPPPIRIVGTTPKAEPAPSASSGIDAADLLALDLPPLREIVPGLLVEGTTVIASPPKIGKSCLVYQIAVEVALGGDFLGRHVEQGDVLYLALEDGRRRGQVRLRAALEGRTLPRGRLQVQWSSRRIGEGLEDDIAGWLEAHPNGRMVAIDTLQRVRPPSSGRRGAYEVDVEDLGRLQTLFRDRPTALAIVHHARKEAGDDFLASVSGTYGITGSADTIVVLRRKRLEAFGSILVTGREIADAEIPVRFDGLTWQPAPQALSEASFERAEVYGVIERAGPIFPAAIAEQIGLARTSVQNMVSKLVDRGAVARTGGGYVATAPALARGLISIPDDSSDSESHQSHGRYSNDDGYGPGAWQVDVGPAPEAQA
jgi:AAA domain/Bifunctional DNA primase/polymerase, N-terminal